MLLGGWDLIFTKLVVRITSIFFCHGVRPFEQSCFKNVDPLLINPPPGSNKEAGKLVLYWLQYRGKIMSAKCLTNGEWFISKGWTLDVYSFIRRLTLKKVSR